METPRLDLGEYVARALMGVSFAVFVMVPAYGVAWVLLELWVPPAFDDVDETTRLWIATSYVLGASVLWTLMAWLKVVEDRDRLKKVGNEMHQQLSAIGLYDGSAPEEVHRRLRDNGL